MSKILDELKKHKNNEDAFLRLIKAIKDKNNLKNEI